MEVVVAATEARLARTYDDFDRILDQAAYDPLPEDWLIGVTDVVNSTAAIRRGAYEDVNFVGVSVIAALGAQLGGYSFPFAFAGDGTSFAVPQDRRAQAARALRQVIVLAWNDFDLELRGGLVPVRDIRASGQDVKIARYAASEHAVYAMFAGGGRKWAEAEIKQGRYAITPDGGTSRPDLSGLSCEWRPIPNRHGLILSLLMEPLKATDRETFAQLARHVLEIFRQDQRQGHPLPPTMPAAKHDKQLDAHMWLEVIANSDFRKYDDILRLTLDCSTAQADRAEEILRDMASQGHIRYGAHRQTHALMTCFVPSSDLKGHLHFLDGADGGYARAADNMS
jgi:hypothetical protein